MSFDKLNRGYEIWQQVLKEFQDVRNPHAFGNLAEGEVACILEAPNPDRIRELFDRAQQRMREVGLSSDVESETGLDILPLEFQYDGSNLVYQRELTRV